MATTYVAFLRGINVGGRNQIKMGALKEAFESLGFSDVRTVLASGNVLFDSRKGQSRALTDKIRGKLKEILGEEVGVMLRSDYDIREILTADPFKEVEVTPQTRLYVSFLGEEPEGRIELPIESPEGDMKILGTSNATVFATVELSKARGTTELMKMVEDIFGRDITTRNWNTIVKVDEKL